MYSGRMPRLAQWDPCVIRSAGLLHWTNVAPPVCHCRYLSPWSCTAIVGTPEIRSDRTKLISLHAFHNSIIDPLVYQQQNHRRTLLNAILWQCIHRNAYRNPGIVRLFFLTTYLFWEGGVCIGLDCISPYYTILSQITVPHLVVHFHILCPCLGGLVDWVAEKPESCLSLSLNGVGFSCCFTAF